MERSTTRRERSTASTTRSMPRSMHRPMHRYSRETKPAKRSVKELLSVSTKLLVESGDTCYRGVKYLGRRLGEYNVFDSTLLDRVVKPIYSLENFKFTMDK